MILAFVSTLSAEARAELDAYVEALIEKRLRAERSTWLTVAQAAEELGCSEKAVRSRISRGRIPAKRQGARLYIRREDLVR